MRVVIQKVKLASVTVNNQVISRYVGTAKSEIQ